MIHKSNKENNADNFTVISEILKLRTINETSMMVECVPITRERLDGH